MSSLKHHKTRNISLIYETLIRRFINESKVDDKTAIKIIKKFFKKGTELNKELHLCQSLYEKVLKENVNIERYLIEIINHDPIDLDRLKTETYELGKVIKEHYNDLNEFFNVKIPQYKVLASIYQLLVMNRYGIYDTNTVEKKMIFEDNIKCHLELLRDTKDDNFKLNKLQRRILFKKFNEKYDETLNEEQKKIVSLMITRKRDQLVEIKDQIISNLKEIKPKFSDSCQMIKDKNPECYQLGSRICECITKLSDIKFDEDTIKESVKLLLYGSELITELKEIL